MGKDDQIKAYEALFRQFQPPLVKFAWMQLRSEEDAREVVQDVFVNIWLKRDRLEFNAELKAYLYKATRNHCLNRIKRNRLDTVDIDDRILAMPSDDDPDSDLKRERIRKVRGQIQKLPANCREIFLMSRMEGLSHKEIAEVLDLSPKTVENQIGIALRKIRKGVE